MTDFWNWFSEVADRLADDVESDRLLEELDRRVRTLHSSLSWEIGPGKTAEWYLAISPNLDPELFSLTKDIVNSHPTISRWEFVPARQPKDWDGSFEIERATGGRIRLDSSGWKYVILKYPDGRHEIILHADAITSLNDDERYYAAAIVLEGLLGEQQLMEKIEGFELTDSLEPKLAARERPIAGLKAAMSG